MSLKLLEALEKNVNEYGCAINDILYDYDETLCFECHGEYHRNCNRCKDTSREILKKLKEEANGHTVEYTNLDVLDSLKYKLKEKYDILFNKYELTSVENGELIAITQTLQLIDDIMGKQATSDKTSDTTSDTSSETRKELDKNDVNHPSHYNVHKHECIDEMIALFGVDETMVFCKLNAWKYRYRAGAKDGEAREKDLAKADGYIEKLMELKEKEENGVY